MRNRVLSENGLRTHLLAFDVGDDVMAILPRFAHDFGVSAASVRAIGGFSEATLAFFDADRKEFVEREINEQCEVVSLLGDIALGDNGGEPAAHVHVALALRSCKMRGGHLIRGIVRPTLELILIETPAYLRRRYDADLGIPMVEVPATERWRPPSGVRH